MFRSKFFLAVAAITLLVLIATVVCLVFIGRLAGVREGSVIAALLVGNIIKLYNRIFEKVAKKA